MHVYTSETPCSNDYHCQHIDDLNLCLHRYDIIVVYSFLSDSSCASSGLDKLVRETWSRRRRQLSLGHPRLLPLSQGSSFSSVVATSLYFFSIPL